MINQLKKLKTKALKGITSVKTKEELDKVRILILGRKGELTKLLKGLKKLSTSARTRGEGTCMGHFSYI